MKRILGISLLLFLTFSGFSQLVTLTIDGVVQNTNGSAAQNVAVFAVVPGVYSGDVFTTTGEDGTYSFVLELEEGNEDCFSVFIFDCEGSSADSYEDCYSPNNLAFEADFIYCENGTDGCLSIIKTTPLDTNSVSLSTINFGISPYTYIWDNGETNSSIVVDVYSGLHCVTITDSQECETTACIDLSPPPPCFVNIFEIYHYEGATLHAEAAGNDMISYAWSNGENTEVIEVTESGEYCVTITDSDACEAYDCRYVEIDSFYNECFGYIFEEYDGSTSTTTLSTESFGVGVATYAWTYVDSLIGTTASIMVEEEGQYCVSIVYEDGCTIDECYDYAMISDCQVYIFESYLGDSIELEAYSISNNDPITYQWSTGEYTSTILTSEPGEYCVTITDAEGCESSECVTVFVPPFPCNLIVGVFDEETHLGESGTVELYQLLDNGETEFYRSATDDSLLAPGAFVFSDVLEGEYIVLAKPDDSDQYAPTYSVNSLFWDESDVVVFDQTTEFQYVNIYLRYIESIEGPGSISGEASNELFGGEGAIENANVLLMKDGELVGQTVTDEYGAFIFDDLAYGTYRLYLERVGQLRTFVEVALSANNSDVNDVGFGGGLSNLESEITFVQSVDISPNPTLGNVTVEITSITNEDVTINLHDLQGRKLITKNVPLEVGGNSLQFDMSMYSEGIYFLNVTSRHGNASSRIVKF